MSDPHVALLEAQHAAVMAEIAPIEAEIASLREKRRPLLEARNRIEATLAARKRLAGMSPLERAAILREMGAVIAAGPTATAAAVRG